MSEFHYYCPTSDAHVCIWFYVRRYASGATEIETVVENGWLNVASPGEKDYSVTISVGGSARYSGAIKHYHHSRWSRVDWIGADPAVTAQHAVAYLRSTRLVPNYGTKFGTPTTAAFTPYAQASTPMGIGNWRADFTGTGDGDTDQIGPLPPWEALYFTTADSRAFNATVANARMAGSHPAHYRDETTGRPLRFSQHPTKSLQNGTLPSATGGSASTIDLAHGAAMGYVAYLVTGRWSFMEEAQLWATWNYLILDAGARGNSAGRFWGQQVRGVAWGLRQLALAATITSDGDATLKSDLTAGYDANILYMYDNAVNPAGPYYTVLGVVTPPRLDSDDATGNGYLDAKNWQHDFLAVSLGWASDLEFSSSPYLTAVRDHAYRFTIGRLGTTTYNYRRAGAYQVPVATPENWVSSGSAYLSSWTAVYAALKASQGLADVPSTSGLSMLDGSTAIEAYRWTMSYTGQAMAACVYAVDHGATGASASYALLTASSSWPLTSAFANSPKWGLVPR